MTLNARPIRFVRAPALALALLALLTACGKKQAAPEPVRAVRTQVITAASGSLQREFSAEIRARTESRLGFQVPGKVTRRAVDLGQRVQGGQLLAQIDGQDLRLSADAARAGLAAAEVQASQAAASLKRFKDLRAQGFISEAELDRHVATEAAAQAALRQARAQAGVQSNQTGYASLTAGASGVITAVDIEPGQVVAAGQPVLTLAHDGPRDAVFAVPEDMGPVVRALLGKAGGIQLRLWGKTAWTPATVREMAAATDPVTRTLLVKADVAGVQAELGQTASVMLKAPTRSSTGLPVPLYALAEREGRSVVWVLDPKAMVVNPQTVQTADTVGNLVLVVKGLQPGQEIVTAGAHVLMPGQKVKRYVEAGSPTATAPAGAAASLPSSGAAAR